MREPQTLLKLLAVLLAAFAAGHTYGALWFPSRGAVEEALFESMRQYTFPIMGVERSHWQFYRGFALFLSVNLIALALLVWQLAGMTARHPLAARPLVSTLFAATIGFAVLSWWLFFAAPAVISTAAALVAGVAAYRLWKMG